MKKLFLLTVLIVFMGPTFLLEAQVPEACKFSSGTWISKTPMPEGRAQMVAGIIDGKIYCTCGYYDFGGVDTSAQRSTLNIYDPVTDTWDTTNSPLPYSRWVITPGSSAVDGKFYVVGGIEWEKTGGEWLAVPLARVDVYDPQSDSWELKANLPEPMGSVGICSLEGKLYVTGGLSGQTPAIQTHKNLYMYDPDRDQWTAKADMNYARADHVSLACNGKIYVFGGNGDNRAGTASEVYDPELDRWTEISSMLYGVFNAGGCVINNEIYLFGGRSWRDQVSMTARILKYSPDKDQWSVYGYMPEANWEHTVCAFGDAVYVIGGHGVGTTTDSQFRVSNRLDEFKLSDLVLDEIIPNKVFPNGESITIDLSEHFIHLDEEPVSYTICTSKEGIVSYSLDGDMLNLVGQDAGMVQVNVRAESANDESGYQFKVELTPGVSVKETASDLIQLFPNPAGDKLSIQLQKEGPHDYMIYTVNGQKLLEGYPGGFIPIHRYFHS